MNYLEDCVEDGCEWLAFRTSIQLEDVHTPEQNIVHHLKKKERMAFFKIEPHYDSMNLGQT